MRDVSLKHTSRTSAFVPFDSDVIYPVCGGRPSDPSSLLATATAQMLLCVSFGYPTLWFTLSRRFEVQFTD